ncbi:MAG: DUF393 domain-containing protein [Hahellaceae bacterium]|nr:DUF393 domain-containing protein [Hahellaceae bacterium]
MTTDPKKVCVFYDGSCPGCVKDRATYEKLAGKHAQEVEWLDITGQEETLRAQGIDPRRALLELHVRDEHQKIHSELDAYILLMRRTPVLRPLAWLIGLPGLRQILSMAYRRWVRHRLKKEGRL